MGFKFNPFTGDFDMVGVVGSSGVVTESQGGTNQTTYTKGDLLYASAANTLSKLAIGSQEQILAINSSGVPYWRNPLDPLSGAELKDDFTSGATLSDTNFADGSSGAGAAVGFSAGEESHPGIRAYTTGTTNTGYSRSIRRVDAFRLGGGLFHWMAVIRLPILSTLAEEYIFRVGLGDSATGTAATDGIYFEYDRLTSGDFWRVVNASNASRTTAVLDGSGGNPTSAVAAATWYRLEAVINAAATSVDFYVNGTLVKTQTSNIPTGSGRETGVYFSILKSAGTTSRTAEFDLWFHRIVFSTQR